MLHIYEIGLSCTFASDVDQIKIICTCREMTQLLMTMTMRKMKMMRMTKMMMLKVCEYRGHLYILLATRNIMELVTSVQRIHIHYTHAPT
jgi:hypothetical protein